MAAKIGMNTMAYELECFPREAQGSAGEASMLGDETAAEILVIHAAQAVVREYDRMESTPRTRRAAMIKLREALERLKQTGEA